MSCAWHMRPDCGLPALMHPQVSSVNELGTATLGDPATPMGAIVRILNNQLQVGGCHSCASLTTSYRWAGAIVRILSNQLQVGLERTHVPFTHPPYRAHAMGVCALPHGTAHCVLQCGPSAFLTVIIFVSEAFCSERWK